MKPIKTIILIIILAALAVVLAGVVKFNTNSDTVILPDELASLPDTYTFVTDGGEAGSITYTNPSRTELTLVVGEATYELTQAESASGIRYTNEDERVVYWEHQGTASIEINGVTQETSVLEAVVEDPFNQDTPNEIYFDPEDGQWKDNYGVCHTCTPENGFNNDGTITVDGVTEEAPTEPSASIVSGGRIKEPSPELTNNSWMWVSANQNGEVVTPSDPTKFVATFNTDGNFGSSTDCNGLGGSYSTDGSTLSFGPIMSTLMYCEGSMENVYSSLLGTMTAFTVTSSGTLVLTNSSGDSMTFTLLS